MKTINQAEFDQIINNQPLVLVDFFATWCGPCKMLGPVLKELSQKLKDKVEIVKVDVDEEQQLAMKFGIMAVPTMIIFKNGKAVKQLQGFQSAPQLESVLTQYFQ